MVAGRPLRSVKLTQQRKPHKPGPPALNVAGTFASALAAVALAASGAVSGAATAVTLSGPGTVVAGQASTYTVALNGASGNVTVTIAANGLAGTLSTPTVLVNSGSPTATFTFTPASSGAGTLSITNNAGLANLGSPLAISTVVAALNTTFSVTPAATLTAAPFAFGHVFKQTDVPAGQVALGNLADWQCNPLSFWPDGSLRHAIIAGRADVTAGLDKVITLSNGTQPSSAPLTEANLSAVSPNAVVTVGAFSVNLASLIGTSALKRTVVSGAVMSNWLYRAPVTGSNHLVVWFDVRLYKGGAVEVFPWLENAYFLVASPVTIAGLVLAVSINGAQVYSQTVTVAHHTRLPLINGTTFSYWIGTDPQLTPKHNGAYLRATKMVPLYGALSPSAAALNGLQQSYSPNTLSSIDAAMGNAGTAATILSREDALYVTSSDARAWRASFVFALSGGSWSVHYRDATTNDPFAFITYPRASTQVQDTPTVPTGSGTKNGTEDIAHQPNFGYLMWLLSGRWWFLEEMLLWAGYNYLQNTVPNRLNDKGVIRTNAGANQDRGGAWGLRTIAQSLAALPTSHPCYASMKASWEGNMAWYAHSNIDVNGGIGTNALGVQGWYSNAGGFSDSPYKGPNQNGGGSNSATILYGAGFEQMYFHGVMGFTWELDLIQTATSKADHQAVRDFSYIMPVSLASDGQAGRWSWRNATVYALDWGRVNVGYQPSYSQAWIDYKAGFNLSPYPSTLVGNSMFAHSSLVDANTGDSSPPFFGAMLVGLTYAADHGFRGAARALNRVNHASNFNTIMQGVYNDSPLGTVRRPFPTWRQGLGKWQWKRIAGSSMSGVDPSIIPAGISGPSSRINAWAGLACNADTGEIWSPANGGHGDYSGNEMVYEDLRGNSPTFSMLRQPTPAAQVLTNTAYYTDGRPTSEHSYYGCFHIPTLGTRGKVFRFSDGAGWNPAGNTFPGTWAWDIAAGDWDGAGTDQNTNPTWPSAQVGNPSTGMCQDPSTWDVYYVGTGATLRRFNAATGTFQTLAAPAGVNADFCYYRPFGYDNQRGRIMLWGNAYSPTNGGYLWTNDGGAGSWSTFTFSTSDMAGDNAAGMHYDELEDRFIVKTTSGATVLLVNPTTFAVSTQATSGDVPPNAINGVFGRFMAVPGLGGYAYYPDYSGDVYFLATV